MHRRRCPRRKCFTNVTKTFANLTTYSRKPGDYNGTIIFEIDIMKKSSPINLNLCQTWLFHNFFGCFFCFVYSEAELRVLLVQQKRSVILVLTWQKNVNFRLSGDEFFMISISKWVPRRRSGFSGSLQVWRSAVRALPPATLKKVISERKFGLTQSDNACTNRDLA